MDIMPNSNKIINQLHETHGIIIATSRPENLTDVTIAWLKKHKFNYHDFVICDCTNGLTKASSLTNIDLLIDDDLKEVIAAGNNNIEAVLYNSPWNYSLKANNLFKRLNTWEEIYHYIKTIG